MKRSECLDRGARQVVPAYCERDGQGLAMMNHYYEVQVECYNASGQVYFSENYRYSKRQSALQKLTALKRHHPSSEVVLIKKTWVLEKNKVTQ